MSKANTPKSFSLTLGSTGRTDRYNVTYRDGDPFPTYSIDTDYYKIIAYEYVPGILIIAADLEDATYTRKLERTADAFWKELSKRGYMIQATGPDHKVWCVEDLSGHAYFLTKEAAKAHRDDRASGEDDYAGASIDHVTLSEAHDRGELAQALKALADMI